MNAITATTARRIAGEPDAPYVALERRWREIGGMLELARGSTPGGWCAPWKPTRTSCAARWRRSEAGHNGRHAALRSPGRLPPLAALPLPSAAVNVRAG